MALNLDAVGREYPGAQTYVVGREKIREFAHAIGDDDPACHDPAAAQKLGYADVIAPPTFPVVLSMDALTQVMQDPSVGIDYSRIVHSDQKFEYHRPIVAGDELTIVTVIANARVVAGNDMLTTRGEISTVAGELVAVSHSTVLARAEQE